MVATENSTLYVITLTISSRSIMIIDLIQLAMSQPSTGAAAYRSRRSHI